MALFSSLDKKVLLISVAVLVIALVMGFIVYKYTESYTNGIQNITNGAQTEQ